MNKQTVEILRAAAKEAAERDEYSCLLLAEQIHKATGDDCHVPITGDMGHEILDIYRSHACMCGEPWWWNNDAFDVEGAAQADTAWADLREARAAALNACADAVEAVEAACAR